VVTRAPRPGAWRTFDALPSPRPASRVLAGHNFPFHPSPPTRLSPPPTLLTAKTTPSHAPPPAMARTPTPQPDSEQSDSSEDGTRYPAQVTELDLSLVSKKLKRTGWKVNRKLQMCYIFDSISPGRQWKRNSVYTEADPWATYGGGPPWPDVTESDERDVPQQPYFPREVK